MFLIITKFLIPKGYRGFAVFPFVFHRNHSDREDLVFVNHEKIHLRQQLEMWLVSFFIWYFIEFLLRFIQYRNWNLAYQNISFEREAYENETEPDYLKRRSFWGFRKYI
jgi:hypothetical protein